jgi:hypothetical protein
LLLGLLNRSSRPSALARSLLDTVKTTAMIFTILIGAILFNNFLILASMPTPGQRLDHRLPLGKTAILLVIIGMYFILGCLLDSLAMILLTIPIVFPIISALGYDPVWFGIIIVMVVELGLITPPIGMNVFVIKGIARDVPLETIFRGVTPFIVAQIILILILIAFPADRAVAALDDGVTFKGTDGIGVACSGSRELVFTNHAFVAVHLAFHPILEDARLFRQQPKNLEAAAARAFLVPIGREAHGLPDGIICVLSSRRSPGRPPRQWRGTERGFHNSARGVPLSTRSARRSYSSATSRRCSFTAVVVASFARLRTRAACRR